MKQILKNILLGLLSIFLFSYTYIKIFNISLLAVVVILIIISLYALCMDGGEKSMKQLKKYEILRTHRDLTKNDCKNILFYSLTTLSPTYFCILLVSVIPIFTYEVWFVTVFPCIIIISMPMFSVIEVYHYLTKKKLPFIMLYSGIVIFILTAGITATSFLIY